MKKLLLLLFIGIISFAAPYTSAEKKEIIKQFDIFQKAVKSKNLETITNMTDFPLSDIWEQENKDEFFANFKALTLPKVNTKTYKIDKYLKKGTTKKCSLQVTNQFVAADSQLVENYGVDPDNYFVVTESYFSDFDENVDACSNYNTFFFKLENKNLKLVKIIQLP